MHTKAYQPKEFNSSISILITSIIIVKSTWVDYKGLKGLQKLWNWQKKQVKFGLNI